MHRSTNTLPRFIFQMTIIVILFQTLNSMLLYKPNRVHQRLPSKSRVAELAANHFGRSKIREILECSSGFNYSSQKELSPDDNSPWYTQTILDQYSSDHFEIGSPSECDVPITRIRVQHLLHSAFESDGGTVQCPEVGEIYEAIARAAPDDTVFCETGFNVGSSAAIFLHGSYGTSSEVHSFDLHFPYGAVSFLNEIYSPGKVKLHAHIGQMTETLQEFFRSGKRCDVVFLDAKHPEDLELTKLLARGPSTLFLYHWHFRNKESKQYFTSNLNELNTFTEIACMKTLCDFSHEDANKKLIRESCFGRLPGSYHGMPPWWHQVVGDSTNY